MRGMSEEYSYSGTGETNGLAIAAMICSLVGIFFTYLPIVGAILGYIALKQIRENPGKYEGETMAKVGLYLGIGLVIFKSLMVILFVLFYVFMIIFALSIPFL